MGKKQNTFDKTVGSIAPWVNKLNDMDKAQKDNRAQSQQFRTYVAQEFNEMVKITERLEKQLIELREAYVQQANNPRDKWASQGIRLEDTQDYKIGFNDGRAEAVNRKLPNGNINTNSEYSKGYDAGVEECRKALNHV